VFVLLYSSTVRAQSLTQLKSNFDQQIGAEKAVTGIQLARFLADSDSKEANEYLSFSLDYAEKTNNKDILGNALLTESMILVAQNNYKEGIYKAENAVDELEKVKSVDYITALQYLTDIRLEFGDLKNIEVLFNDLIQQYQNKNDQEGIGYAAYQLANIHEKKKNFKDAIEYYSLAAKSFGLAKKPKNEVQSFYNLAGVYNNYGDYKSAGNNLITALDIAKKFQLDSWKVKIEDRLEKVQTNEELDLTNETTFDREQQQLRDEVFDTLLRSQRMSLEEIEKLSEEKQLIELKIRVQQDEYERQLLEEKIAKLKAIDALSREKLEAENLKLILDNERLISDRKSIENQRLYLVLLASFLIILLIVVVLLIKQRSNKRLSAKNKFISEQNQKIEDQANKISQSIQYAKEIQEALLPSVIYFEGLMEDNFVLSLPKDEVSGDFLWYAKNDKEIIVCAADCTGHGVPGAFITIVLNTILEEIVNVEKIAAPDKILELSCRKLKDYIQSDEALKQQPFRGGMDASIIRLNTNTNELEFAGARSNALLIKQGKELLLKGSRKSVQINTQSSTFELQTIQLNQGDQVFLYTDGFADQKSAENGEKFMAVKFRELLVNNHHLDAKDQKSYLLKVFQQWKGSTEQIDDVLVVGLRC
jgi:serine phosphatase RsbU (regulator of sigma subunit)